MYSIEKSNPELGCKRRGDTIQWGIYSSEAQSMVLKVYKEPHDLRPIVDVTLDRSIYTTGDIFHIAISGIGDVTAYTWQVKSVTGEISDLLIDPYSQCIEKDRDESNRYINLIVDPIEKHTKSPHIPWEDTILYELHVGSFTKSPTNGNSVMKKGTFIGLMEKLPYLKGLGVTSVELLPVFEWNKYTLKNTHPSNGSLMKDEWGYNTIAFFALHQGYGSDQKHIREEFLMFIEEAHELGMEVILDVVYNHTGEGGEGGSIFNFKALGEDAYYKKINGYYMNCAGTGNVLNNTQVVVKNLIIDSLRYWVVTFGVDGFRFDLASILQQDELGRWMENGLITDIANDPILRSVKLISESWDAKGSYDVGRMPKPFREWSDFYRDTMRKVVRGDMGMMRQLAQCIVGEDIRYSKYGKGSSHSIHFITAHDGFTMWDLVSYNIKHNEMNGEENRDGNNSNYSYNCGVEGETTNEVVLQLRYKKMKNFFAILMLSKGIPMILMGDEIARTQEGNNNAFCQDNEMSWMNWHTDERKDSLRNFLKQMIGLRKEWKWLKNESNNPIGWHGVAYGQPDWSYHSRSLAWEVDEEDQHFYVIFNNYTETLYFELPPVKGKWLKVVDTDKRQSFLQFTYYGDNREPVAAYSLCIFKETKNVYV